MGFEVRQIVSRAVGCALLLVCSALVLAQGQRISVSYQPMWEGPVGGPTYVIPVRILLQNNGDDDIAEVSVSHGSTVLKSIVELPGSSEKAVEFYIPNSYGSWESPQVRVLSRQGIAEVEIENTSAGSYYEEYESVRTAFIGDEVGSMGFMRSEETDESKPWFHTNMSDVYAQPGLAPTRSVGYMGLNMIVLGDGAERLSDAEVQALKGAVLTGSKLIFLGGAAKPILNDPRWTDVLPVVVGDVREVSGLDFFDSYGEGAPERVTFTEATLKAGAGHRSERGQVIAAWKPVGAGAIGFLAYDPFAGDMRSWEGRKGLFFGLNKWIGADTEEIPVPGLFWEATDPWQSTYDGQMSSVFQIELPEAWKVASILFLYVILVIPVNFLVLRKLGKGELAWITAPIFAAVFAGVFFTFSGSLYEAGLSRQTQAVVIASSDMNRAMVLGKQQIFFPQGGRYDLGFQNMELAVKPMEQYDYGRAATRDRLEAMEFGSVMIPSLSVSNLTFWDFEFAQAIDWNLEAPGKIEVWEIEGGYAVSARLANLFDSELKGARLVVQAGNVVTIPDVQKGAEIVIPRTTFSGEIPDTVKGTMRIEAVVPMEGIGASVGSEVAESNVTLYWDVPVEVVK